jgi:hypothetical protein
MNMHFVTRTYLRMQRLEVFLAVLLPFFLIIESALANGTVYAGGALDFHEVLTYACAKLTKLLILKQQGRARWSALIPGLVALWCVVVSAGNNLGWVISGDDFIGVFASMGHFMPAWLLSIYEAGLGLLLPIAVAALALVDISHLVREALEHSHFDNEALRVAESEMHRSEYLKSQNKQRAKICEAYDGIAEKRADDYIGRVNKGDMSFGATDPKAIGGAPGIRRLAPPPPPVGGAAPATLTGQVSPASPFPTGNTQPINVPPVVTPPSSFGAR